VTVSPGFWRLDEDSANIIQCMYPFACNPPSPDLEDVKKECNFTFDESDRSSVNKTYCNAKQYPLNRSSYKEECWDAVDSINDYCRQMMYGTPTGVCNNGYRNVTMCGLCDDGYGIASDYSCNECVLDFNYYLHLFKELFIRLSIISFTVYSAHTNTPTRDDREKSCSMRILINYFQILFIFTIVPMRWPDQVQDASDFLSGLFSGSNANSKSKFSYECIILALGFDRSVMTYYEFTMAMSLFSPLVYFFFFALLSAILRIVTCKCRQIISQHFVEVNVLTAIVVFFYIWPSLMQDAFTIYDCIEVSDPNYEPYKSVVKNDPSIVCYQMQHYIYILITSVPILLIWGLAMPIYLFTELRRNKKDRGLNNSRVNGLFGFIYQGYRTKYYWWEFTGLIRKIVFLIVVTFISNSMVSVKCYSLFLVIAVNIYFNYRTEPFVNSRLNYLEQVSLISLCTIIFTSFYQLQFQNETSTLVFALITGLFTLFFFVLWFSYYIFYVKKSIVQVSDMIKKYSMCFARSLLTIFCIPKTVLDNEEEKKKYLGQRNQKDQSRPKKATVDNSRQQAEMVTSPRKDDEHSLNAPLLGGVQ